MKHATFALLAAAVIILHLPAAEAEDSPKVQLSEHLKAFERVLGTWELSAENEKGVKVTMRWVFQATTGGNVVTGVRSGARSASSIFYYDPELRKVVCVSVLDSGHVVKTIYTKEMLEKDEYSALSYFTTPDGKQATSIEHIRWIGKDQIAWNRTDIFVEGEKRRPESPETIMNRVK